MTTVTIEEYRDRLDPVNYLPERMDAVDAGVSPVAWRFARSVLEVIDAGQYRRAALAASAMYVADVAATGEDRVSQTSLAELFGCSDNGVRRHMQLVAQTATSNLELARYDVNESVIRHFARTGRVTGLSL
jgi:hypothetical protein